jgi:hypothetical protein
MAISGQPVPVAPQMYFYSNWFALHLASVRLAMFGYSSIRNRQVSVPDPTEQLVSMIRDLVEARGKKFLVDLQSHEPPLETFLNSQNISYTRFDEAERYPAWGSHWTPAGHELVAQRLVTPLSQRGYRSSCVRGPVSIAQCGNHSFSKGRAEGHPGGSLHSRS